MRILRKVFFWLFGIAIVLTIVGFFLPKTSIVEKTAVINASPNQVHALLNNMKTYDSWMTWNKMDPKMTKEYGPQTAGAGAFYSWKSDKMGNGKMTIKESTPAKINCELLFEGFNDPATSDWEIKPSGNGTELKWSMHSNNGDNPFYRWMGLFMNSMVGGEFEKSFANINQLAEKGELK
jgi:ribosome-associated toxin RatA of RatAB toxin-antitoxin module